MLSICIPTYNRLPHLKKCINSILKGINTDYPYEIIIADGGSTDGTIEYLNNLDNVILIEQGKLTGAIKAFNICFKKAKGDFIFFGNDDFEIFPNVLIKACKFLEEYKQVGLVAPKIQEPRNGNLPGVTVKKYWILLAKIWIFRKTVLKKINYFDENYRTYYIDDDGFLSVMKLGYTTIFTKEVGIIHHRVQDENVNIARKINIDKAKDEKKYLKEKWSKLEENIERYLEYKKLEKFRSNANTFLCNKIYESKNLRRLFPMWLYDILLERVIIFKDKKFDNCKDFYLAQKYPEEVISNL